MTTPLSFTIADDKAPESAKPKPRRGRPPGSTSKPKTTGDAATVKQALATLDSAYNALTLGLTLTGLTGTAALWVDKIEALQKSNEDALKAAPRLAASIANAGSVGGATTFFISHVMTLAPVLIMARGELALRREAAQQERASESEPTHVPGM